MTKFLLCTQVLFTGTGNSYHIPERWLQNMLCSEVQIFGLLAELLTHGCRWSKSKNSKGKQGNGGVEFFWQLTMDELKTKIMLYKVIPLNLLLWGAKNWSQNAMLDRFHHRAMCRILGISITNVGEEHITNADIRRRFGGIPEIALIIARKQMKWIGKLARIDPRHVQPKILTCFIQKTRCSGRRYRTTRDGIYDNLCRGCSLIWNPLETLINGVGTPFLRDTGISALMRWRQRLKFHNSMRGLE